MWRMIGYSSVIPLPPRMSRQVRAISSAMRTLFRLIMLTCCGAELLLLLEARGLERHELARGDLREHLGELRLHELVRGDGLACKLHAILRVVERAVEAGARRADDAPRDAEARLR